MTNLLPFDDAISGIVATQAGQIDNVLVEAGTAVSAGTVLLTLQEEGAMA